MSSLFPFANRRNAMIGIILTLACSLIGQALASLPGFSLIGHLVLALVLGMVIQFSQSITKMARESTGFIANKFLRAGIILLGFKLNLVILMSAGLKSLEAAVFVVAIMITINYFVARFFRVDHILALLTACGCSICGAAAVMGISSALKAKADQSVLAVAIVAILGTVFTLVIVFLQPFLGFSNAQFGVMAGLSLHEIAHAVAAGGSAGRDRQRHHRQTLPCPSPRSGSPHPRRLRSLAPAPQIRRYELEIQGSYPLVHGRLHHRQRHRLVHPGRRNRRSDTGQNRLPHPRHGHGSPGPQRQLRRHRPRRRPSPHQRRPLLRRHHEPGLVYCSDVVLRLIPFYLVFNKSVHPLQPLSGCTLFLWKFS